MAYGYGRGFGSRGASPPWPYVGRGRGGLPRCWHPDFWGVPAYGPTVYPYYGDTPYTPPPTKEAEMDFLKNEAEAIRAELGRIESRMRDLETGK